MSILFKEGIRSGKPEQPERVLGRRVEETKGQRKDCLHKHFSSTRKYQGGILVAL